MNRRERMYGAALGALLCCALAACGGGGGGGGSQSSVPAGPVAAPTPTPVPVASAAAVTDSAAAALSLHEDPNTVVGDTSAFGAIVGASGTAPIDGLACLPVMQNTTHYHVHFSLFVNGHQYAVPAGTGIYEPSVYTPAYLVFASSTAANACYYEIHVHALEGMIHIEDHAAGAVMTLGEFLDIWGQRLSTTGFGPFGGATRWFDTDEAGGTPGTHPVTEQTGTDPHLISLIDHHEYTVEVGPTYVQIPNFTWSGYP